VTRGRDHGDLEQLWPSGLYQSQFTIIFNGLKESLEGKVYQSGDGFLAFLFILPDFQPWPSWPMAGAASNDSTAAAVGAVTFTKAAGQGRVWPIAWGASGQGLCGRVTPIDQMPNSRTWPKVMIEIPKSDRNELRENFHALHVAVVRAGVYANTTVLCI